MEQEIFNWLSAVIDFLNSNFFIALVTIVTGFIAYLIYKKQKKDEKRDAANIILLEIQNAERQIKLIKDRLSLPGKKLPEELIVMPTSKWHGYKYLFVRDFDRDSWDSINEFYNRCRLLDEALENNKSYFQKNEVELRANRTRIILDYLKEKIDQPDKADEIEEKRWKFADESIDARVMYDPNKPVQEAEKLITDIGTGISQTIIGSKLRSLAKFRE